MQKLKMLSLISAAILLTGCSMTKINQSQEVIDGVTGDLVTETVDSGVVSDDTMSGAQTESIATGDTTTGVTAATTTTTDDPATVAENNALKEKIRTLIEKRRIESKPASQLTEEDIQLMEDVLKTIVEETTAK